MSRISDILSRVQAQFNAQKQSSGSLNSRTFEGDLVAALRGSDSLRDYQSAYSKGVAKMCAGNLVKLVGQVSTARNISAEPVGGAQALSPLYRQYMCRGGERCNGDSKADLVIVSKGKGKMGISIKKEGDAQIASAQANEINAVITAALGEGNELVGIVRAVVSEILPKEAYYRIRNSYGDRSFDSLLTAMTGLGSGSKTPDLKQLEAFAAFLEYMGIKSKISEAARRYMTLPETRRKILREFASGSRRFAPKYRDRVADWMMVWGESGRVSLMSIDEFVERNLGSFRMSIRDRGAFGGGALRIDIREWMVEPHAVSQLAEMERRFLDGFDMICLEEGVLDTATDLVKTAGKAVAQQYRRFVAAVRGILAAIARLFTRGVGTALAFFDLEIEEMSYNW